MGIEKLTSSLLKEAEDEAVKIVASAKWHVDEMVKEERKKEGELKLRAEEDVKKVLGEQRNERLAWARLEAKRVHAEAREDAIKVALDELYEMAPDVRKSKEYASYISKAVAAAVDELGGNATVHVLKGEKKLFPKIKVPLSEDLDAMGGAIVESNDGKMRVDLRLETLFETRADELRREISDEMFGKK
ncbi:MAG: V-type ATP synthase subunit E [Candidatus Micrarchaeota archaeon]